MFVFSQTHKPFCAGFMTLQTLHRLTYEFRVTVFSSSSLSLQCMFFWRLLVIVSLSRFLKSPPDVTVVVWLVFVFTCSSFTIIFLPPSRQQEDLRNIFKVSRQPFVWACCFGAVVFPLGQIWLHTYKNRLNDGAFVCCLYSQHYLFCYTCMLIRKKMIKGCIHTGF